jgi:hypothetical protein
MIQGQSGCEITISNGILKKSSGTKYPIKRLKAQINKQRAMSELSIHKNIDIPKILGDECDEVYSAYMQYFPCSNIIQYLHRASKDNLDSLSESLIAFLSYGISNSQFKTVPSQIIIDKFESIEGSHELRGQLDKYLQQQITIPVGFCHGDLTLSNVLFAENSNKIILIDFLDSFIESPIIDIAKIRQDTKHGWSSFIHSQKHDRIKTQLSLDYIDKKIEEQFCGFEFFKHYKLFQFMNLVRILPYAKQTKTSNFIMRQICSL